MTVDVRQIIEQARDSVTGRRVFSDPYEHDGVSVILASRVQGGGGGGAGEDRRGDQPSTGWGSGFGVNARPVGAFVIRGDEVRWVPAIDVNRIVLGAQVVAITALLTVRTVVRVRAKRQA